MALNPTTPGVYIQEISTLAPSVAPVPTAVPVFIGYTAQAVLNGQPLTYPTNPIRITSMLDFLTIFGGGNNELFDATLTGTNVDIATAINENSGQDFRLFYHMQMFYANGGGNCYIISVGNYGSTNSGTALLNAISLAEQVDEITMVVVPEAVSSGVTDSIQRAIYDEMLAHCAKLQDRFSIFDVKARGTSIADDADKFRNLNVSANNLNYGAAYYPPFTPTISFDYIDAGVTIHATDLSLPASVQAFDNFSLDMVNNGRIASVHVAITPSDAMNLTINNVTVSSTTLPVSDATALANAINLNPLLTAFLTVNIIAANDIQLVANNSGSPASFVFTGSDSGNVTLTSIVTGISPDKALYNRITAQLTAYPMVLYPSATMAGIYTSVDNDRGVWKAPANVGVSLVSSLNILIKDSDQEGLNVDPTSGKSIDAIRNFSGRGILVWGARTLDGNSNEWRYVNVRRLFIFAEHSCKLASEFVVFEPNDKNTWLRVKSMISNFLTNLWRDGALAGDKPEQAFFVKVGLGETMTAQDILEGRLIVQIGLAAVRPAEFIVLQFEHKLQEA